MAMCAEEQRVVLGLQRDLDMGLLCRKRSRAALLGRELTHLGKSRLDSSNKAWRTAAEEEKEKARPSHLSHLSH